MQNEQRIGFIGLGAMGAGMAASLARAGCTVAGFDLRPAALVSSWRPAAERRARAPPRRAPLC